MSTKSKGNAAEIQAQRELEADGWTVHRACRKAAYARGRIITKGHDIFGSDLIAKRKDRPTRWINVTTIENKSAKVKEFAKYPWTFGLDIVEIWCKIPRKGWRKFGFAGKKWWEF